MIRAGDLVCFHLGFEFTAPCDEEDGSVGIWGVSELKLIRSASESERIQTLERTCNESRFETQLSARRQLLKERCRHWHDLKRFEDGPYRPHPSAAFENESGTIQNLVEGRFAGVALIRSKEGAIRSNHYHETDEHFLHVVSGKMLYWEARAGEPPTISKPWLVEAGQTIWTGPRVIHATAFLEETLLVSISKLERSKDSHESDVMRVAMIEPEHVAKIAPWVSWR